MCRWRGVFIKKIGCLKKVGYLLAVGGALLPTGAVRADQALVVGNNHYPAFSSADDLAGCENDARLVNQALSQRGFQVTLLVGPQAVRPAIVAAMQKMAARIAHGERFVFYFAGHGTRVGEKAALVLRDSHKGEVASVLTTDQLFTLVKAIPTPRRTVLLDSCYSEGMMRARGVNKSLRKTRYVSFDKVKPGQQTGAKSLGLGAVNRQDTTLPLAANADICYFTASRLNEEATEDRLGDAVHGVFTYYLTQTLRQKLPRWGDIQPQVSGDVAVQTKDHQHPTLTPQFIHTPVFDALGGSAPVASPTPLSLWELFCSDHVEPAALHITMQPDQAVVEIKNEKITFEIATGRTGYLVVLEHGTHDDLQLLFPMDRKVESSQTKGDESRQIPAEKPHHFQAQEAGDEHIKAFLFNSREAAEKLLAAFPPAALNSIPALTWEQWRKVARHLHLEQSAKVTPGTVQALTTFITSDIHFYVTPQSNTPCN